ncbi:hypothetical protein RIR_jg20789.t1 [Rhizophagus irregularis DAOM 181602=DAOM 197198]|uniref:Uncharacterized protein n=1 Tax=Rhizophagus irregularis (strain DAOM 197198w) TaxID=1432141 RepID=A0A015IG89_RHIIW|nr:hypothetical protein RirG_247880 [Rhizophagus irregularis DAOM 197198w]GBC46717.1 hypothetical protein RIR_jg20789.t1 [Rhizophagus irregularis DAOM 181602=DAOM 197198]CAB5201499.1 unnamed protein product [Rhizophagus irregularis]CAG8670880.1 11582_t:CDS:2 [Rhizophagus irregularis]
MTYFKISAFVIFGLPKIVKIFREFNIKKYALGTDFKRIILKPKLQLLFLVLGILVYRHSISRFIGHFIMEHQKTIKDEMHENQQKDFADEYDEDLEEYDLGPDDVKIRPQYRLL